ncbi:MAG: hypothetical protein ACREEP_20660 [Dongiaceae bacterium]
MTTRTTKTTVTFTRPFSLSGFDGEQPAGSYSVETDEELLDGVSFPAYRRMATMMQLEGESGRKSGIMQIAVIDPRHLAAALAADAAHGPANDEFAQSRALNMPGAADQER